MILTSKITAQKGHKQEKPGDLAESQKSNGKWNVKKNNLETLMMKIIKINRTCPLRWKAISQQTIWKEIRPSTQIIFLAKNLITLKKKVNHWHKLDPTPRELEILGITSVKG